MTRESAARSAARERCARASVVLLAVGPALLLPGLDNRWLWPPLIATLAAALLSVFVPSSGRIPRAVTAATAVAALVFLVAAVRGEMPVAQLLGRQPRFEGLIVVPVLLVSAWTGARLFGGAATASRFRLFIDAVSMVAVVLATIAVCESVGLRPIESDLDRPGSIAGNATDQGLWAVAILALVGSHLIHGRNAIRALPAIGTIAAAVALVTSASRADLIVGGIVAVGLVLWATISREQHRLRTAASGGVAIATAVLSVWLLPAVRVRLDGTDELATASASGRWTIWGAAMDVWRTSPWWGVGPSGFADAVPRVYPENWYADGGLSTVLDSPHNIVLQMLVAGGILGLLAAAIVAACAGRAAVRGVRASFRDSAAGERFHFVMGSTIAASAGILILMTHVTSPRMSLVLMPLIGSLIAVSPAPITRGKLARTCGVTALAAWLAFLAVLTVGDAHLRSGALAVRAGEVATAVESYEFAQGTRPWDADIALQAARSLAQAPVPGALPAARDWAVRATTLDPSSAGAWEAAGMIALSLSDPQPAAQALARAAELSPVHPRIQHEYGVALLAAGDSAAAARALMRAQELAPGSIPTREALAEACRRSPHGCDT